MFRQSVRVGITDRIIGELAGPVAAFATGIMSVGASVTADNAVGWLAIPAGLLSVYGAFALYRRAGRTVGQENDTLIQLLASSRKREHEQQEEIDRLRAKNYALSLVLVKAGIDFPPE